MADDGTSGQDRESYSDEQDRDSYTVKDPLCTYCRLPLREGEEEMCDPCYEDRAPLWRDYHEGGGHDPLAIAFDVAIYEVGGSVRDGLLGINSKDKDFAVEAPSYERMKEFLEDRGFTIFVETPEFLTIRAHFPNTHPDFGKTTADFVLCRKDGAYSDGRHPDEVTPGTIYDDLARRDFTVNAMAKRLGSDEILDPFDGQSDLNWRLLRVVGEGDDRIREDPLRAIRALRFWVVKGLAPTPELADVLSSKSLPPLLSTVSQERIREELHKMFKHDTKRTLTVLFALPGIVGAVFPADGLWLKPTLEQ